MRSLPASSTSVPSRSTRTWYRGSACSPASGAQLEDLAESRHLAILPVGRLRMLSAPARGDRPATTDRRWQTSPPSFSRRPSTTSWPRRGACAPTGSGTLVTYSPKVFVPLTTLCRDVCGYCTFARPPRRGERAYLTEDEVLAIARAGAEAGCTEALFTLGDRPEARYRVAREELAALGCEIDARVPRALREAGARGDGAACRI